MNSFYILNVKIMNSNVYIEIINGVSQLFFLCNVLGRSHDAMRNLFKLHRSDNVVIDAYNTKKMQQIKNWLNHYHNCYKISKT